MPETQDSLASLLARNVEAINRQFDQDPSKILVAIQLEEDQLEHLASGLRKRSRRLVPLPALVELIGKLLPK